jgi:hypothetical protein
MIQGTSGIARADRETHIHTVAAKLGADAVNPYSLGATVWQRLAERYGDFTPVRMMKVPTEEFDTECRACLAEMAQARGVELTAEEVAAVVG